MKRTTFNLTDADLRAIKFIRKQYNLTSDTAAIRLALALAARKEKTMEYPLSSSQEARIRFDDLCYRQASEDVKSYVDAGGDLSDFDLDAYWIMFESAFNPDYDDADEAHARFMDQYRKVLTEYR